MKIGTLAVLAICPFLAQGQQVCATCHAQIAGSYRQTGMARSFSGPAGGWTGQYDHSASDTHFQMIERDGKFFQRRYQIGFGGTETNVDEKQIDFVMGSGNHVRTFLHRTAAGALQELPLAWYAEKGGEWAMNPGYDKPDQPNSRRKITYECMFCHNAYPEIPDGHDRFRAEPVFKTLPEGIDCQRCHGPGERHVEIAKSSGATRDAIRKAIVNPARLTPERQMEVCMQCHLETTSFQFPHSIQKYERHPFSYRPGEPLGDFLLYFDHPEPDRFQIVNSAYRLRMSQCFLKSAGGLQCTTCHDPHRVSSPESMDRACTKCHATRSAAHPKAPAQCAGCHMPKRRTVDVVHAVMTDHYIQRRPLSSGATADIAELHGPEIFYRGEVLPYYPANLPGNDLYLALAQVREGNNLEKGVSSFAEALRKNPSARPEFSIELADAWMASDQPVQAIPLYREALRRDPGSPAAMVGLGNALEKSGDLSQAAEIFQRAAAWLELGQVYTKMRRTTDAAAALRKALANDSEVPEAHYALGLVLAQQAGDPAGAERSFREAIRLRPDDPASHMNLAIVLFGVKRTEEAAYHFERALRYNPRYGLGHLNYGLMLEAVGRIEQARREIQEAVGGDPATRQAALKWLERH